LGKLLRFQDIAHAQGGGSETNHSTSDSKAEKLNAQLLKWQDEFISELSILGHIVLLQFASIG
jgi:hypothetical protein